MTKKISKELREWIILISVGGLLFFTGWYKDVASFLQRGLLETGLMQPSELSESRKAEYNFELIGVDDQRIHFSDFKGKTVFINLWATWCPPCIAEMPDIHDLYEKMGDDVEFVMISVDEDQEKAKRFVDKKGFTFPVYFLPSGLPSAYETSSIPSTFVLSPNGKIVVEEHGLSKYDTEKFRTFLKDLTERELTP